MCVYSCIIMESRKFLEGRCSKISSEAIWNTNRVIVATSLTEYWIQFLAVHVWLQRQPGFYVEFWVWERSCIKRCSGYSGDMPLSSKTGVRESLVTSTGNAFDFQHQTLAVLNFYLGLFGLVPLLPIRKLFFTNFWGVVSTYKFIFKSTFSFDIEWENITCKLTFVYGVVGLWEQLAHRTLSLWVYMLKVGNRTQQSCKCLN